jgi:molybdenum cofactor guanylyltransferase
VNAFILAGGQSKRMGRDKALLPIAGRMLIERMLERVRDVGFVPRICGSRPDLARFAEIVPDTVPGSGPLAGIEAALAISDSELNLFVPVDLPGLPLEFLGWLAHRAETSEAIATIPRYGDRPQPLCAVYSKRLASGLRDALRAGRRKVMVAIQESASALGQAVDSFDVECVAAAGPARWAQLPALSDWFRNANTPADYEALLRLSSRPDKSMLEQKAVIQ